MTLLTYCSQSFQFPFPCESYGQQHGKCFSQCRKGCAVLAPPEDGGWVHKTSTWYIVLNNSIYLVNSFGLWMGQFLLSPTTKQTQLKMVCTILKGCNYFSKFTNLRKCNYLRTSICRHILILCNTGFIEEPT